MNICLYFQVHQPYRLRHYKVQDIGEHSNYFDDEKNQAVFRKVAGKCYLPTNALLLHLCKTYPEFRLSFSFSGSFLKQCQQWGQDVLESFQKLAQTGQMEILAETANHSLASMYSKKEFAEQIHEHQKIIETLFGVQPKIFRNTELIYNNEIAEFIRNMGFQGIVAEGADHILGWRSPNYLYKALHCELPKEMKSLAKKYRIKNSPHVPQDPYVPHVLRVKRTLPLLLKNYKLSDDIAFRFSNRDWKEFPLTSEKFASWIDAAPGQSINLFMDYETFGEHQWEDTGIFQFLEHLPRVLRERKIGFRTPSETIAALKPISEIDMHSPVSWADLERDLSAWNGNEIQRSALAAVYALEPLIKNFKKKNSEPSTLNHELELWRKLQTSDHFYYMCTKYWSDGDVHKYFSPYDSPYDAYIYYMNAVSDLEQRIVQSLEFRVKSSELRVQSL